MTFKSSVGQYYHGPVGKTFLICALAVQPGVHCVRLQFRLC